MGSRPRRGRNTGNDVDGLCATSSSDDRTRAECAWRPKSAWNSRSGRRPQFTFTDLDATGGDDSEVCSGRSTQSDPTVRKSTSDGGGLVTMASVQPTARTARRRASQIPVRKNRHHPTTINHVDERSHRHSVCVMLSDDTTSAMLDLSRDQTNSVHFWSPAVVVAFEVDPPTNSPPRWICHVT